MDDDDKFSLFKSSYFMNPSISYILYLSINPSYVLLVGKENWEVDTLWRKCSAFLCPNSLSICFETGPEGPELDV
jgi:hypothetical protein